MSTSPMPRYVFAGSLLGLRRGAEANCPRSNDSLSGDDEDGRGLLLTAILDDRGHWWASASRARPSPPNTRRPILSSKPRLRYGHSIRRCARLLATDAAQALPQKYSHYRTVRGDGNCGWRGETVIFPFVSTCSLTFCSDRIRLLRDTDPPGRWQQVLRGDCALALPVQRRQPSRLRRVDVR